VTVRADAADLWRCRLSRDSKITAVVGEILSRDAQLREELEPQRSQPRESVFETLGPGKRRFALETIVLKKGRPVLAVSHDEPQLRFEDAESEVWRERLIKARPVLVPAIRAVGRIELQNHPRLSWVGTGWLVRPDVIVTNRHIAREFGRAGEDGFFFRLGPDRQSMSASIDFLEEFGNPDQRPFRITSILDIADEDEPDLAFLRVEGDGMAPHISLQAGHVDRLQVVAAIGYPARDSRIPDQLLVEEIFGDIYDKKRLAPGQIIACSDDELQHDCSTLGGNSGSVILDISTGQALGVHFAGAFLESNYAVPASTIADRLQGALNGQPRRRIDAPTFVSRASAQVPVTAQSVAPLGPTASSATATTSVMFMVPVRVSVEVGVPQPGLAAAGAGSGDALDAPITEAAPEDYRDRQGYQEDFLGPENIIRLPKVVRDADQVLAFTYMGKEETLLRYQHFSVIMNRQRRMCFYSAVNIDGKQSRKSTRTSWRTDPRIDKSYQIMYECYGSPPKFSRGHMTRREDPVWGTPAQAGRGNSDSMHVTNTTPQMQSFNAPVWLGLEDYALQNARHDKMKISVFTGPILGSKDPVRYQVKIPRSFWKVIAFIHDETGKLTVTGYVASQEDHLPEFVFSEYDTWQRSLFWIERKAGISFGDLSSHDPLSRGNESLDAPLSDFDQIRLRV
jgi:endonuclease G